MFIFRPPVMSFFPSKAKILGKMEFGGACMMLRCGVMVEVANPH